jgi:integrase
MPRKARKVPWIDWRGGIAYACWYDAKALRTKRLSLHTREAGEAQARFAAFLAEGPDFYSTEEVTKGLSVAQSLKFYFEEHRQFTVSGQSTFPAKQGHLNRHLGDVLVRDITKQAGKDYVRARQAEGAGLGSIRNELIDLMTAARHNVAEKRLKPEEVPVLDLPAPPEARDRWLTQEELQALRAAAVDDCRDFIDLCYWTASRRKAIETLTKFQVKLGQKLIHLAKPGEQKTKKRRPIVPIAPQLLPVVQRLMKETPGEYLLPRQTYEWSFGQACEKAGLEDVSPHTLRHTRITHLLQAGINPWAVAGLAGLTVATLTKVYAHHCPSHLREVIEAYETNPGA